MRKWQVLLELGNDDVRRRVSYRDIVDGIARAIREGRLAAGSALPGTREMATILGVNRKTVILAYEEAAVKGWLVSEQRRGSFVSDKFQADASASRSDKPGLASGRMEPEFPFDFRTSPLPAYFDPIPAYRDKLSRHAEAMYFNNGAPDHRLLPQAVLHRHYRNAMQATFRSDWVRYGNRESEEHLRSALAAMLGATRALAVSPSRICLTQGTQTALHLIAAALIRPGDVVVVERLSYPPAWAIFQALGARIEVVDIDADGCVVQQLEDICQHQAIRFIYLTPHHQFPTTVSLRVDRRERLLALSVKHSFTIIEEDYDHEYHFTGRPYAPLASDSRYSNVIYIGSLSKLLGSTFRCGFIVAPENLIQALSRNQILVSSHGDAVMQKMLAELISNGELRRHVRRSSRHYLARQQVLLECLHRSFGDHIATRAPEGGLALWVTFHEHTDVDAMVRHASAEHLFLRSGRQFAPAQEKVNGLRLGFASMTPDELVVAVTRLQRAWKKSRN